MPEPLVFSTLAYSYLGDGIASGAGWERGAIARKTFPDGEHYRRIETDPADRDVILVGGTIDDANTLELYDLACGLVTGGAYRLRLVIPFYGYATMERSVRPGEVVTAKTRARLLSSIQMASRGTQVFLLDLHVDAIAHYFEGGVRTIHVYGKNLVTAAARRLAGEQFVLACTDAGRAKWVESLANDLGVQAAFVYKRRLDGDSTEVTGVSAQVGGKRVVIYDDMIRTGGSLLSAAQAYTEAGAISIDAIATHGLFPGDSLAKLRDSGLFGTIVVTDSHPRAVALRDQFLHVEATARLLIEHLNFNR
ncbi:MAG: ribose-phosphate diphosphokinase [Deltaproteobacteria bacterium]|nr:ribose-phosphate diphosphokinase [Deltaproteobacteria bacterium]